MSHFPICCDYQSLYPSVSKVTAKKLPLPGGFFINDYGLYYSIVYGIFVNVKIQLKKHQGTDTDYTLRDLEAYNSMCHVYGKELNLPVNEWMQCLTDAEKEYILKIFDSIASSSLKHFGCLYTDVLDYDITKFEIVHNILRRMRSFICPTFLSFSEIDDINSKIDPLSLLFTMTPVTALYASVDAAAKNVYFSKMSDSL